MFTNRISAHFDQMEQIERLNKTAPGFVALPAFLVGRPQPFTQASDIYRYAYECAKADLLNQLVALLRSRWDLIHVTGPDVSV